MAIDIPFNASVDVGDGAKSLRSLKQEFKETQKELDGLNVGSEKYVATLQKLGKVKDEIGDLNQEINAFNPEGKVQAFGNVIGGLASGFQAATGAAALFGGESKDVEKALLRVQAVMAFTEGIKGVVALGDGFKVLGNIIKANPIFLIVSILAAITAAVVVYFNSIDDGSAKQARMNDLQKQFSAELEKQIDIIKKRDAIVNTSYRAEIELLKARGATIEEINEKENEIYEKRRQQLLYIQGFRGQLTAEESKELLALTNEKILRSEQYVAKVKSDLEAITKKNKEELDKQSKDHRDHLKEIQDNINEGTIAGFEIDDKNRELKDVQDKLDAEKRLADSIAYEQTQDDIKNESSEKDRQRILDTFAVEEQTRLKSAETTRQGLLATQSLSDLVFQLKLNKAQKGSAEELKIAKKQFEVNKGLQLGLAAIDGYKAISASLASSPIAVGVVPNPVGIASLIFAATTTIANIAKIAATQFNGGGQIGSLPSPPSGGSAPTINAPRNSVTDLNPDGTVKSSPKEKTPIIKAIVTETDITSKQTRINSIQESATIG